jgi:hypothetical protein
MACAAPSPWQIGSMLRTLQVLATLGASLLSLSACSPAAAHTVVELGMTSAYRPHATPLADPASAARPASGYTLLAGDMHCHVQPPDHPTDVTRTVPRTVELARKEGLDFVVLTPHVAARFFTSAAERRAVLAGRAALREALVRAGAGAGVGAGKTTFVLGMEYTDHRYGHLGAAFADLEQVLADVPVAEADRHPERFFEAFVAHGGVLVFNHPLVTPLDSSLSIARADLSFRPFVSSGPFPPEILAAERLGQGIEAFNLVVTHLRDRYLLRDTLRTLEQTLSLVDREAPARRRRLVPVGGSDSHGDFLRATTFLLSRGRSESAIRDALLAGRACVRSPEACSLEARPDGGAWAAVGASLRGVRAVEARAHGEDIEIFLDGRPVEAPPSDVAVRIPVDERRCSVLRARVGEGYSAPIYVNCPFD